MTLGLGTLPTSVFAVSSKERKSTKQEQKQKREKERTVEGRGVESWTPEKEREAQRNMLRGGEDVPAFETGKAAASAFPRVSAQMKNGTVMTAESPEISESAEIHRMEEMEKARKASPRANRSARPVAPLKRSANDGGRTTRAENAAEPSALTPIVGLAQDVQPNAAQLLTSFDTADFDTNPRLNNGGLSIPPDPDGAAGPNHVLNVVNTSIEWYLKDGTRQVSQSLRSFFTPAMPPPGYVPPLTATFDPKVVYDQFANRFVVVTLEFTANPNTSRILLAVSDDSDPNGNWNFLSINALENVNGNDNFFDFPGFGFDGEALYITGNIFGITAGGFGGVRLYVVPKEPFYSGGAGTSARFNPIALATGDTPAVATTLSPAITFGTAAPGSGIFMMQYSGLSDGTNEFLGVIQVQNPLSPTPTFTNRFVPIGDIDATNVALPTAPQRGTGVLVATNDRRISNHPVFRNNMLYTAAPTLPTTGTDANQTTVRWWRVDVSNFATPTLADSGTVGGENIGRGAFTAFPCVAVDAAGNMALGFSVYASNIFPSSGYTARLASDPAGTTQPASILRFGTDYYLRRFGGLINRWGDYTGITLDPADQSTFWVYGEHSIARGTVTATAQDGRWATAFGRFSATITTPVLQLGAVTAAEANPTVSNNNGAVEPGEIAFINVELQNTGTVAAQPVTGTLTTTTPGVTVLSGANRAFPTIGPNAGATSVSPFAVQLAPNFPCGGLIDFTLQVASNAGPASFDFQVGVGPGMSAMAPTLVINETLDATAPAANPLYTAATGLQTGSRLNRDGVPSTCEAPKSTLGQAGPAGSRRFDAFTFRNPSSAPICVTINHASTCTAAGQDQFSAVYSPNFDTTNVVTNWRADRGVIANSPTGTTFSVTIPARESFTLVVSEINVGGSAPCGTYSLTIGGLVTATCAAAPVLPTVNVNNRMLLTVNSVTTAPTACGPNGAMADDVILNATLTNVGATSISNILFEVAELREANGVPPTFPFRLLSAMGATCTAGGLVGARQTGPAALAPGATAMVQFRIARESVRRFRFLLNVLGSDTGVSSKTPVREKGAAMNAGPLGFDVDFDATRKTFAVRATESSEGASASATRLVQPKPAR
jgi:hypothetical protein